MDIGHDDPVFWLARAIWRMGPSSSKAPLSCAAADLPVRSGALKDLYRAYVLALQGRDTAALCEIAANLDWFDAGAVGGRGQRTPTWDLWRLQIAHAALDRLERGDADSVSSFLRARIALEMSRLHQRVDLVAAAKVDLERARELAGALRDRALREALSPWILEQARADALLEARQHGRDAGPLPRLEIQDHDQVGAAPANAPVARAIAALDALVMTRADLDASAFLDLLLDRLDTLASVVRISARGQASQALLGGIDAWMTRLEDRFRLQRKFWNAWARWDRRMGLEDTSREFSLRALEAARLAPWGSGLAKGAALDDMLWQVMTVLDDAPAAERLDRVHGVLGILARAAPIISSTLDAPMWLPTATLGLEVQDWRDASASPEALSTRRLELRARISVRCASRFHRAGLSAMAAIAYQRAAADWDGCPPCRRKETADLARECDDLDDLRARYGSGPDPGPGPAPDPARTGR